MKKIIILIFGLSPFLIGYGINLMIYRSTDSNFGIFLDILCFLFLVYWGLLGFLFSKFTRKRLGALLICNLPALIVLLLILVQELIYKRYWVNAIGFSTQFFFLPILRAAFMITAGILHYMWQSYIVAFLLMAGVFYLGGIVRDKL